MTKKLSKEQRKIRAEFRKTWARKFRSKPTTKGFKQWARNPASATGERHTYYVTIEIESDGRGSPPYAEAGQIIPVTLALLRRQKNGKLVKMTYDQLARNFDQLVEQALRRANFSPANEYRKSIRSIFRHKVR